MPLFLAGLILAIVLGPVENAFAAHDCCPPEDMQMHTVQAPDHSEMAAGVRMAQDQVDSMSANCAQGPCDFSCCGVAAGTGLTSAIMALSVRLKAGTGWRQRIDDKAASVTASRHTPPPRLIVCT